MDDFLKSHFPIKYLIDITKSLTSSLKNVGFSLTKFTYNQPEHCRPKFMTSEHRLGPKYAQRIREHNYDMGRSVIFA